MEPEARSLADVWEWELDDEALDRPGVVPAAAACCLNAPVYLKSAASD